MKTTISGFKKICILIILFFSLHQIQAQKIIGTIEQGTGDSMVYFVSCSGLQLIKDSAVVKANHSFSKDFRFANAKMIVVNYHSFQKSVYVFPNAQINIRFNAANDSSFKHTFAVTADDFINRYLDTITNHSVYGNFIYDRINTKLPVDSLALLLHQFRRFTDSLRSAFFIQNHQNIKLKPLHDFLITDSINWYANSVLTAMDYFHVIHTGNTELFWKNEVEDRMPLTYSDGYLNAEFYNRLWKMFFRNRYGNALESADSVRAWRTGVGGMAAEYIQSKNIQGKLKEVIASQVLNNILATYTYKTIDENKASDSAIAILRAMITEHAFLTAFDKDYSEKKELVYSRLNGTKAPDFSLLDTAGKAFTLNNFWGKIILIDVWASWCKPCLEEMPYLKLLEQKLKQNKTFQLVSVSVDNTKQAWVKNGILRVHPPGLLLWQGDSQAFTNSYHTQLIPQLFLLDDKGKFIDFNPPRASDGNKLYQLIAEHLK